MADCILLLMPTTTYKAEDFLAAATRLGVEVLVGTDRQQVLERQAPGGTVTLDFARPDRAVARIASLAAARPLRGIVGTDDETVELAALAAAALGLPHSPVAAVRTARDKYEMRRALAASGLDGPGFERFEVTASPEDLARRVRYPCVLKPLCLSASRGVLRVDDPTEFVQAFGRIRAILQGSDVPARGADLAHLLVEDFRPGAEVALEGLLAAGRLHVLALFDKPDPLEGPTFEETIYVTPSRHSAALQQAIVEQAARGAAALGLVEGPVHAELRLHEGRPWIVEIAPRTIGGLCSRALRFGAGVSLEELILRHALGDSAVPARESAAAGVMMIPVPRAGRLRAVRGRDDARRVDGVLEVTISLHRGARVVPLPEGHRYLGFIFARGERPDDVEQSLRRAHACLSVDIDAEA